jgi:hypothetical protein
LIDVRHSYVDAYGLVQSIDYIGDPIIEFRTAEVNIPIRPEATIAEFGNFNYVKQNVDSAKRESNRYGRVTGSYS